LSETAEVVLTKTGNTLHDYVIKNQPGPPAKTKKKDMNILQDNPVEKLRKSLPQKDNDWPGHAYVWNKLQEVAHFLASNKHIYLSDDHIEIMAVMGTGNEELMKGKLLLARDRGWIQ
jgi:hypothetical protein